MKFFHISFPIDDLLLLDDESIQSLNMTDARGKPVEVDMIRNVALHAKSLGFTFLPPCRECDSTGRCLGHPIAHTPLSELKNRVAPPSIEANIAVSIKPQRKALNAKHYEENQQPKLGVSSVHAQRITAR